MRKGLCPSANELQAYVAGSHTAKQRASMTRHLDTCRLCELVVCELMSPDPADSAEAALRERFELIREIGRGGTSVVFEARPRSETNMPARVAIKLLDITSSRQLKRFDL